MFTRQLQYFPKLTLSEKRQLLYPYYAGFSQVFVSRIFEKLDVKPSSQILDPWNGSGTTTLVAALRGVASVGYDLNPCLVAVARARAASRDSAESALENAEEISSQIKSNAVNRLSTLGDVYRFVSESFRNVLGFNTHSNVDDLDECRSILLTCLFSLVRGMAGGARTKNPTWYRLELNIDSNSHFVASLFLNYARRAKKLLDAQSMHTRPTQPKLRTRNFNERFSNVESFDFIITSPPYLTRIDYVMSTLPELSLLSAFAPLDLDEMRRQMLGSPLTKDYQNSEDLLHSPLAVNVLRLISAHSSKASSTYYRRFFGNYFEKLQYSMENISKLTRSGGGCAIVVQPSNYKEIFVDLPTIVAEMGYAAGLEICAVENYTQSRTMATVNRKAVSYSARPVQHESVVYLRKM